MNKSPASCACPLGILVLCCCFVLFGDLELPLLPFEDSRLMSNVNGSEELRAVGLYKLSRPSTADELSKDDLDAKEKSKGLLL